MFTEIHCVVKGKVRGVGYRDFIERYTKEQGLMGWIRNNDDGSVEAVIQGTPDELKSCIEILNQGSLLAKVESMAIDWRTPEKQFEEFRVISS
jgi:acylphosphatase